MTSFERIFFGNGEEISMDEKVASVLKDEMNTENTQSGNGHF
jgi:hypothetical protein